MTGPDSIHLRAHRAPTPGPTRSKQRVNAMVIHGLLEALVSTGSFPELLTAEQVSALLGVSAATLNRWAALRETTGEQIGPPCYTLSERVRRWDCAEVRSWLKQVRR
jgi:predicted DNA-binding transcriptional regulator AlpA